MLDSATMFAEGAVTQHPSTTRGQTRATCMHPRYAAQHRRKTASTTATTKRRHGASSSTGGTRVRPEEVTRLAGDIRTQERPV